MKINKTYLVRKNVNEPFGPDNWYIFTEAEFYAFKTTPEFTSCKRYFGQEDYCEGGGDIIIAECTRETALEMERVRARKKYQRTLLKKSGIKFVSYEEVFQNVEGGCDQASNEALLADESANVEDIVITREMHRQLRMEVRNLSPCRRKLIETAFFEGKSLTDRECARRLGCSKSTVTYQRNIAFEQLREKMADWKDGGLNG